MNVMSVGQPSEKENVIKKLTNMRHFMNVKTIGKLSTLNQAFMYTKEHSGQTL
jgi:hypothetical protein